MSSKPPPPVPSNNSRSANDGCETPLAGKATTVPKSFLDRLCREFLEQFSQYGTVADAVTEFDTKSVTESRKNNEDDPGEGNDYDSNPSEFTLPQHLTKEIKHCCDAAIDSRNAPESLFVPEGRMDQHSSDTDDTLVDNEGDADLPASCEGGSWHNTRYSGETTLNSENNSHQSPMALVQVSAWRDSSDSETHVDDFTSSQDCTVNPQSTKVLLQPRRKSSEFVPLGNDGFCTLQRLTYARQMNHKA